MDASRLTLDRKGRKKTSLEYGDSITIEPDPVNPGRGKGFRISRKGAPLFFEGEDLMAVNQMIADWEDEDFERFVSLIAGISGMTYKRTDRKDVPEYIFL